MTGIIIYMLVIFIILITLNALLSMKLTNLEIKKSELEFKVLDLKMNNETLLASYRIANEKYLECDRERKQLQQKLSWIRGSIVEE